MSDRIQTDDLSGFPDTTNRQPSTRTAEPRTAAAIVAEHRLCGRPFDGCYSHWSSPHCRADGMAWPCDVAVLMGRWEAEAAAPAVITDEQAEAWLKANDLYAVTHIHDDPACIECQSAPAGSLTAAPSGVAGLDVERLTDSIMAALGMSRNDPSDPQQERWQAVRDVLAGEIVVEYPGGER